MTVILITVYSVRKQRWWDLWSDSSHNLDLMPRELELIEVEPVDQVLVGSNLQRIIAQDRSKWLLWQSRETPAIWFFFTIYLSSNLGSGLGTRLSFKVLILTEKKFYIPFFSFSLQAGQCTAKPGSNAVKVSNGGHLWKIQRLKCFKGRRIHFVARRFPCLDGMSLRKRLIIWSDHIWFTKADFQCIAWFALVEIT